MCETLWRPKMTPDEVFECISQALMSSLDRDASSGLCLYLKHQYIPINCNVIHKGEDGKIV